VLPYYGGGTEEARDLKGNDFMYWEVMRRATEKGVRVFDYGRSKVGTGSYRFKTHWGFEPEPLAYEYELVKAKTVPEINPLNPKYRYFIAAWQRLPLPVSNLVGPWISRNLG
jgi:FemAB-related protein (PEP-CTERM system-associated)